MAGVSDATGALALGTGLGAVRAAPAATALGAVYVVGGQQRSSRPLFAADNHWYDYRQGVVLRVELATGRAETCVSYVSRPGAYAEGDPILFKSGTVANGRFYACTQTEVLEYSLPDFTLLNYLSLPCFNDVHHVRPTPDGNYLVANSGLEMVLEVRPDGEVLREWNVLGEAPWAAYAKDTDYRRGVNLKPHRAHPNYVFYAGGEVWATRFEKRDVICLTQPDRRIEVGLERVHDGVLHNGRLYLTTVNGHVVIANPDTLRVERTLDLNTLHPDHLLLGWCRGLLLHGSTAWVGFSRIRPTKFREAVSWVRQGFSRALPTHIAAYDLERPACVAEINVEAHGLDAVFSLHPAEARPGDRQERLANGPVA
jgi:hypothetical protein